MLSAVKFVSMTNRLLLITLFFNFYNVVLVSVLITFLLRYISYKIHPFIKYTIHWFLVYLQGCATITTI